jgi:repressor LexA
MKLENIGKKLAELRKLPPKLSQVEAAKIVGVSTRTWGAIEAGETTPKEEGLKKFAASRGMTLQSLLGIRDEGQRRTIPIYATIHAGNLTQWIPDEPQIGELELDVTEPDAYSLLVRGSSMYPEIQEGDVVVCSPHRPFVSGKIVAVVIESEEATVKRIFRRSNGYDLVPTNPEFQTKFVPDEKIIRIDRIIQIRRKME